MGWSRGQILSEFIEWYFALEGRVEFEPFISSKGVLKKNSKVTNHWSKGHHERTFSFHELANLIEGKIFSCLKCIKTIHAKSIQFFKKTPLRDNLLIDDGGEIICGQSWWENISC